MEIKGSLENALREIDALRSKMSELSQRKDIHQIELDILLQKLRELYEFLRSLEPLAQIPVKSPKEVDKPLQNGRKTERVKPKEEVAARYEKNVESEAEIHTTSPEKDKKPAADENSKPLNLPKNTETTPGLTEAKSEESKKSVHELLTEGSQKKQSHIAAVLHAKPIQNIEDAIGVNDKFLFIRELFNSNASRYKETIDILNNAADFNSAYNYIELNFEWDSENEAAQKLLDLVRRRHISQKNG
jgi:hypothetical protein